MQNFGCHLIIWAKRCQTGAIRQFCTQEPIDKGHLTKKSRTRNVYDQVVLADVTGEEVPWNQDCGFI